MPTSKIKRVKGFAMLREDGDITLHWREESLGIWLTKAPILRRNCKAIPCTITYSLPPKKKK